MSRRLRYCVAVSLDGFISDHKGECDWIIMDTGPDAGFGGFTNEFDTVLMGKVTYLIAMNGPGAIMPGMQTIVCSSSLNPEEHSEVTVVKNAVNAVEELKSNSGKDLWLFGGGRLFRTLLDARLVDSIELAVMPIMLGQGIPVLPQGNRSPKLYLEETKQSSSGVLHLKYTVKNDS